MRPKVATFDCYGTLVDWEGGIGGVPVRAHAARGRRGPAARAASCASAGRRSSSSSSRGPYRPYKEILAEATLAWCREMGIERRRRVRPTRSSARSARGSRSRTRGPALTAAREAGVRLVILSNTDRDIISHTRQADRRRRSTGDRAPRTSAPTSRPSRTSSACWPSSARTRRTSCTSRSASSTTSAPAKLVGHAHGLGQPPPGAAARPGHRPDHEWRDLWGLAELAT